MSSTKAERAREREREREREGERGHYKALQRVLLTSVSNPRAALENKIQNSARHRFVKLSVKSIALTFPPLFPLETPSPPLPSPKINPSLSRARAGPSGETVGRNCCSKGSRWKSTGRGKYHFWSPPFLFLALFPRVRYSERNRSEFSISLRRSSLYFN